LADCPKSDHALLACSELAANEVLHSELARPGGRFSVRVEVCDGHNVWVEVEDSGGRWVEDKRSDQRGRRLAIVAALADYQDIDGDDTGRAVCACLDWSAAIRTPRVRHDLACSL
jgi:anti-sigma regulatory factor (Ser/Thr protein kinase)